MSGMPTNSNSDEDDEYGVDFELDLDNLDDAALQRLLEEDPSLEEELRAIEAEEAAAEAAQMDTVNAPSNNTDHEEDTSGDMPAHGMAALIASPRTDPDAADQDDEPEAVSQADDTADAAVDVVIEGVQYNENPSPSVQIPEDPPFTEAPAHDDLADFDVQAKKIPDSQTETEDALRGDTANKPPVVCVEDDFLAAVAPVPRINIHAFCVSDQASSLVEKAAADRRLAKAHVTIHSGDARRAAQMYEVEATPNLLLIEAGDSSQDLLIGLDALAQVCDPSTRVVVMGEINDIGLYRALMERGISEYIVRPQTPLQLIAAIGGLYSDPSAAPIGKTYVFIGARGGAGSSSICHNVAWAFAEKFNSDTVLMDLDLAFGTAGLDFEHDPNQGLAEALAAPERLDTVLLDRLLQKRTDRLSLFVAPNALERDYDLPNDSYESVVDVVRKSAPSIAIDLPHIWSAWAKQMLQSADEIIITATPDLSSFRNAKNIVEIVKTHRTNDAPPLLVLNQVGVPKRPEVPADQFEEALELKPRAIVPWDPVLLGNCATNAQTMMEAAPNSKTTQEVSKIASILLGQDSAMKRKSGFNLKSLFAKRG